VRKAWLALLLILVAPDTRAGGHGFAGQFWLEATGSYMPNTSADAPSVGLGEESNSARSSISGSTRALTVPMAFAGVRGGIDFVASDRWIIPFFDLGVYGAVGTYSDVLSSVDGSIVRFHPASAFMLDAELFGFGARFKRRRWMFEATVKPGVALLGISTDVADGRAFTSLDAQIAATLTLRASLSVCRRLDPEQRVCLSATPNIYQWGWGNGGTLSLRWEVGP